jgi:hypothetical protein
MFETKGINQILSTIRHPVSKFEDVLSPLEVRALVTLEDKTDDDGQGE